MCWISKRNKDQWVPMHCRDPGHLVLLSFGFIFTRYPYLSTEMLSAIYLWRLVLFCLFFVDISRQIFLKIHKSQVSPILTRSGDKVKIQKSDKNIGLLFLKIFNLKCSYSYSYVYTYFIFIIHSNLWTYFNSAILNCRQGKTMLTYLSWAWCLARFTWTEFTRHSSHFQTANKLICFVPLTGLCFEYESEFLLTESILINKF